MLRNPYDKIIRICRLNCSDFVITYVPKKPDNSPMKMYAFFQARRALIFIARTMVQAVIISLALPRKICGGGLSGWGICQLQRHESWIVF
jgi:hypothetical protein